MHATSSEQSLYKDIIILTIVRVFTYLWIIIIIICVMIMVYLMTLLLQQIIESNVRKIREEA